MTIPHTATSEITCPWCGFGYYTKWNLNSSDILDLFCPKCGKPFVAERSIEITYTTTKVES